MNANLIKKLVRLYIYVKYDDLPDYLKKNREFIKERISYNYDFNDIKNKPKNIIELDVIKNDVELIKIMITIYPSIYVWRNREILLLDNIDILLPYIIKKHSYIIVYFVNENIFNPNYYYLIKDHHFFKYLYKYSFYTNIQLDIFDKENIFTIIKSKNTYNYNNFFKLSYTYVNEDNILVNLMISQGMNNYFYSDFNTNRKINMIKNIKYVSIKNIDNNLLNYCNIKYKYYHNVLKYTFITKYADPRILDYYSDKFFKKKYLYIDYILFFIKNYIKDQFVDILCLDKNYFNNYFLIKEFSTLKKNNIGNLIKLLYKNSKNIFEFIAPYSHDKYKSFPYHLIIESIRYESLNITYFNKNYNNNKKFLQKLSYYNPEIISHLKRKLLNINFYDSDLIDTSNVEIENLPDIKKNNVHFVGKLYSPQNIYFYEGSKKFLKDKNFVLELINKYKYDILHVSNIFNNDKDVVFSSLKLDEKNIIYANVNIINKYVECNFDIEKLRSLLFE